MNVALSRTMYVLNYIILQRSFKFIAELLIENQKRISKRPSYVFWIENVDETSLLQEFKRIKHTA